MRFFFRSRNFKIFIAVVSVVLVITVTAALFSNVSSPISSFIGTVTTPIQKALTSLSDRFDGFKASVSDNEALIEEVNRLKEENADLAQKLTEYEQAIEENEFYEQFLGVKDKNPDMLFQSASVSARDFTDPYKGFIIDSGMLDGVALYDPVITPAGLVGYVTEVAPTYSKVTTILSPKLKAGGSDSRTGDKGVVSGRADLAADGKCYFYNLQRDCTVSVGDYVLTAGNGVFPPGIIVGKVADIKQQGKDTYLYAVVKPELDFDSLRDVMVVTYYSGQGSVMPSGE